MAREDNKPGRQELKRDTNAQTTPVLLPKTTPITTTNPISLRRGLLAFCLGFLINISINMIGQAVNHELAKASAEIIHDNLDNIEILLPYEEKAGTSPLHHKQKCATEQLYHIRISKPRPTYCAKESAPKHSTSSQESKPGKLPIYIGYLMMNVGLKLVGFSLVYWIGEKTGFVGQRT